MEKNKKCEICGRELRDGVCPGPKMGFGPCPVCHGETNSWGDCIDGCCRRQYDPLPKETKPEKVPCSCTPGTPNMGVWYDWAATASSCPDCKGTGWVEK